MLTAISDAIEGQLGSEVTDLKTIGAWEGEVEDLLKRPHLLPSAHVVYGGCQFGDLACLGGALVQARQTWTVILLGQNLRSRAGGAYGLYDLIEAIRAALTKFESGYGALMPVSEALIVAQGGLLGYGLDFVIEDDV